LKTPSASSIVLDAIDKGGVRREVRLRAVPIGPSPAAIRKAEAESDSPDAATSNADQQDPFAKVSLGQLRLIDPPYPLQWLSSQRENNTELGQCIRAMVVNTVGFGWTIRERPMAEGVRSDLSVDIEAERLVLQAKLEAVHPTESLDMILEKVKDDQHSCGNGYVEMIEDATGELVGLNHVVGHAVRLTEKMPRPVKVKMKLVQPAQNFELADVPMWHRFRRFAMVSGTGKVMWFKEAGDPRPMDKWTGEFADIIPTQRRATSLLHFKGYNPLSAYGVTGWIGNLFSIRGSRRAEEINFNTLTNNAIPSMFVIVENGALTEASIDRLQKWTEEQVQKGMNYSRFLLMEGETVEDGTPNPQSFRIRVMPLAQYQKDDQLFQKYDGNNREKVRQSFRLPPIFVGRTEDYTRATADTSRAVADEQVFAPERNKDTFAVNRFVLARWGARFHTFKLNNPNVTDDIQLITLMGMAERSGGMTPRRADRIIRDVFGEDIGPMPQGVPLDVPFSVTFAQAQSGLGSGGGAPSGDTARRVIDGMLDLRRRIEKELDDRFFLTE